MRNMIFPYFRKYLFITMGKLHNGETWQTPLYSRLRSIQATRGTLPGQAPAGSAPGCESHLRLCTLGLGPTQLLPWVTKPRGLVFSQQNPHSAASISCAPRSQEPGSVLLPGACAPAVLNLGGLEMRCLGSSPELPT